MNTRAAVYMIIANVLGGSAYAVAAFALRDFPEPVMVFWRTLLGALFFIPILPRTAREMSRRDVLPLAAVGVLGYAVPLILGTIGQKLSSATNASLLVGVEPVSIVLLSALFLGESLTRLKALSIALGLSGSALIVLQGIPFLSARVTPHFTGDVILFLHGFFWALYSVIGKPVLQRMDATVFAAVITWLGLPVTALAAVPSWLWGSPATPGAASIAAILYLGVVVAFLCLILWNKALTLVPASSIAGFIFLQPLVGVFLGGLWHGEKLTPWSAAGGAMILLGVYCSMREK